jgi:hypothetical protein
LVGSPRLAPSGLPGLERRERKRTPVISVLPQRETEFFVRSIDP